MLSGFSIMETMDVPCCHHCLPSGLYTHLPLSFKRIELISYCIIVLHFVDLALYYTLSVYLHLPLLFTLLFVVRIRYKFLPNWLSSAVQVITIWYRKATATTAGTFYVGTVLQPCTCSVLPVISHMKALNVVRILVYSTLHISCCLRFCWPNFLLYRRVAV
jgi:hypothetical protein